MIDTLSFPELTFEEERHVYKLNGAVIPSVTALMKPLSESVYGSIDEAVLKAAAEKGTTVHNAIENFIQFGIEDIDGKYESYFRAFRKFWNDYKPKPIMTESRMYHKTFRYAGTTDFVCEIDGKLTIIDWKTSARIEKMLTGVQLEGYTRAYESHGVNIEQKAIVHLQKDASYNFDNDYPARDSERLEILADLIRIRNYIQKYRGGTKK